MSTLCKLRSTDSTTRNGIGSDRTRLHPGSNQDWTSQHDSDGCLADVVFRLSREPGYFANGLGPLAKTTRYGFSRLFTVLMLFDADVVPSLAQMSQYACDIRHGTTCAVQCEQAQVPKTPPNPGSWHRSQCWRPLLDPVTLVLIGPSPCLPRGVQP